MNNLPDFMIIGMPRCGTSSLFVNLAEHPRIRRPLMTKALKYSRHGTGLENKEIGFFVDAKRWERGVKWYSTFFPPQEGGYLTFEASTSCALYPERVKSILPDVKSIILLRDPTARAWRYFWIRYHKKYKTQSLDELTNADHPAITRGIYIDIIKKWHSHFPKENLLILKSEEWFSSPTRILKQVYEFLKIEEIYPDKLLRADPWTEAKKKYKYGEIPPHIKKWLDDFYRPYNKQLSKYLKRDFRWKESS